LQIIRSLTGRPSQRQLADAAVHLLHNARMSGYSAKSTAWKPVEHAQDGIPFLDSPPRELANHDE
jgi:hypothetical protein